MINEIKDERQNEDFVRGLGVFELRGLAREMGVSSPTTKKREELISAILEVFKNGKLVSSNDKKRGRPFKKLAALDDIVNTLIEKDLEELDFDGLVKFAQTKMPNSGIATEYLNSFEGIVKTSKENKKMFYDIRNNTLVYLTDVEGLEKIEDGDKVLVEGEICDNGTCNAKAIIQINDIDAQLYVNKQIDGFDEVIENTDIPFGNKVAKLGRRNVVEIQEDLFENGDFESICNYAKNNGYKLIVVGPNTSYENQIMFKNSNVKDNFTTNYATNAFVNVNKIMDVIYYAGRLIQNGEKVLVFVCDIIELIKTIDCCFKSPANEGELARETNVIINKFLEFARAYKNGASGTILMCYRDFEKDDKFLNEKIFKISKRM